MQKLDLKGALEKIRFYQTLEPQELDLLLAHSELRSFSRGELILKQGCKSDGLYVILKGSVMIAARVVGEGNAKLASLTQGSLFGGSSLISKGPHATSVLAELPIECLFIPETFLEMLALFYPKTRYKIMQELAMHISERITILIQKVLQDIAEAEMVRRPILSEMIQSLTKASILTAEEKASEEDDLREVCFPLSVNEILHYGDLIKASSRCTLIQEGDDEAPCYLVLKGAVQSSLITQNKVAKISILGPSSLFCPLSLADSGAHSYVHYATCERAVLLRLDQGRFAEMQKDNLTLWYKTFDQIVTSFVFLGYYLEKLGIRIRSELYNR